MTDSFVFKAFIAVILMAVSTYITRVLPLAVFRREIRSPFVKTFLKYIPFSVLGVLTFPDILYSTGDFRTAACGTAAALFLAYREKSLVVVAIGAIAGVLAAGFFF